MRGETVPSVVTPGGAIHQGCLNSLLEEVARLACETRFQAEGRTTGTLDGSSRHATRIAWVKSSSLNPSRASWLLDVIDVIHAAAEPDWRRGRCVARHVEGVRY